MTEKEIGEVSLRIEVVQKIKIDSGIEADQGTEIGVEVGRMTEADVLGVGRETEIEKGIEANRVIAKIVEGRVGLTETGLGGEIRVVRAECDEVQADLLNDLPPDEGKFRWQSEFSPSLLKILHRITWNATQCIFTKYRTNQTA